MSNNETKKSAESSITESASKLKNIQVKTLLTKKRLITGAVIVGSVVVAAVIAAAVRNKDDVTTQLDFEPIVDPVLDTEF